MEGNDGEDGWPFLFKSFLLTAWPGQTGVGFHDIGNAMIKANHYQGALPILYGMLRLAIYLDDKYLWLRYFLHDLAVALSKAGDRKLARYIIHKTPLIMGEDITEPLRIENLISRARAMSRIGSKKLAGRFLNEALFLTQESSSWKQTQYLKEILEVNAQIEPARYRVPLSEATLAQLETTYDNSNKRDILVEITKIAVQTADCEQVRRLSLWCF